MAEGKQPTSWVYELNIEQLRYELQQRELEISGNFAVLRQRLLRAVCSGSNSVASSHASSRENIDLMDGEDPENNSPSPNFAADHKTKLTDAASQTEINSAYF